MCSSHFSDPLYWVSWDKFLLAIVSESGVHRFYAGTMKNTRESMFSFLPSWVMAEVCVDTREPQDRSTCIDGPLCREGYAGESPTLTRHAAWGRNKPLLSEPLRCHG